MLGRSIAKIRGKLDLEKKEKDKLNKREFYLECIKKYGMKEGVRVYKGGLEKQHMKLKKKLRKKLKRNIMPLF